MENSIRNMNKPITFLAFLILLVSCDEEHSLKEETCYFKQENKDWVLKDSVNIPFVMVDDHGISQSFSMSYSTCYFNKSWSSFLGITTHMTHTEYCYTACSSTFGTNFSLSLTAGSPPYHGDMVFIMIGDLGFAYDLDIQTIVRLDSPFGYKSKTVTETGYELNEDFLSTVEYLDSLTVSGIIYRNVLHFTFKDFKDQWMKYTLADVFVAKGYGLVKYVTLSGLSTVRKM